MPDDYGVLLSKSPAETEQKPDYDMLLGSASEIRRNYDLSKGTDPKHEAAVAKVSSITGIGKPLLNSDPKPEDMLPMQPPAPGVSSYLQDMGNMIISRDDIHNLNAVEPKALAFNLDYAKGDLSGQMRTNIQKDIQSNGYTDGQKAELIANGYRPNIDGTWNTPDGRPTSAMPVLDGWVQTADEAGKDMKDMLAGLSDTLGGVKSMPEDVADPVNFKNQQKYDTATPDMQKAMRDEQIARLKSAVEKSTVAGKLPEDFASLPHGTQVSVIQGVRTREGMDASAPVNPSEYLPKTVGEIDPRELVNFMGLNSLRKYSEFGQAESKALDNLSEVNGDFSKLPYADLVRTADLMTRKAEEARGTTFGNKAASAVGDTLTFMGELMSVGGISAKVAKSIFAVAGRELLSPEAVAAMAAKYGAKTAELSYSGIAAKTALQAGELSVQTAVTSLAYIPKVGLTAFESTLPDTLQLTPDEKGNIVAQVSNIKKEYATEFTKAYLSNYIDVLTEGTGAKILGLAAGVWTKMPKSEKINALLSKMTQPMRENFVTSAIASMAGKAKSKGAFLAGLGKFRKGAKWDGFTGEWVEEDLSKAMQYVFTQAGSATGIESINLGENNLTAYTNPEEIALRAVALAVPSLGFGTARLGAHIMEARDTNHFVNKAEDLNKALYNTQTAQRSPIHAALFLDAQGVKGDIYMNSQELLDLENKNPGLLEKIGAPLDLVTSAADTNMDVAVPAVHALSLQPEVFAQLRNVMRPGVSSPSVADLGKVDLKPIAQAAMVEPQRIAEEEKIFQTKLAEKKNEALKAGRSKEEVDAWSELVEGMANRLSVFGGNKTALVDYSIQKVDQDKILAPGTEGTVNGMVDTQNKTVSLFQTANPSTLIHETAHIFKHEMDLLLQNGPPNAELAKDIEVLNDWLNAKPESSKAEYVRMQEQFASGLETYLMEGKAPSVKLAAVFERYKNWLLNVYSSIKNFLAVRQDAAPLNDDMRGFFDRMLATHDETVQAMNIAKLSMYDSPELGGNLEYQVHAKELLAEAVREAEADINAKREKYIKEHKAEWRKEAEDKVYSEPINQAWKKIEDEGGLDKKDLELELSKEEIKTLRDKGLVQSSKSKRNISHSLVANEHGFNSGTELLTALLKAESPNSQIKAALDARIKEFTDTFKPEDYFAEAAAMAKYLELRSEQLNELINQSRVDKNQWKTELNALTGGKVDTPFQTAKVLAFVNSKGIATDSINAKSIAEITEGELDEDVRRVLEIVQIGRRMQNVAKTLSQDAYRAKIAEQMKNVPVGQLESPGHYLRAFKKNMQEAVYAIRKKDWGAALNYNNLARQNYEQLRQSREIRDKVATTVRAVRRAFTAKPGVIEGDFKAWIMQIGRKFGLTERQVDAKLPGKIQLASDNIYFGEEYEPWISGGLLNPTNFAVLPNVSYKGMTAGNFESLANLIDYMDRQGRSMAEGWDATNKKKVVEIMKEIDKVFAANPAQVVEVQDNTGLGATNALQRLTRSYHAEMARLLFVCRELDGFSALQANGEIGPCEKYLYGAMNKAADAESKLSYTIGKQAAPFVKTLNKWVLANSGILRGEGVPDLPSNMKGRYKGWTSEMLMSYMFNRGQADNLQKFIDGYPGLSVADMDAFCAKFAGEEQWKAVQGLLDIIDSFWPELDRVHYNMKLTHMGKMEATAFDITTKEGKVITQKGGYYPVWYDRSLADFQRGSDMTELDFTNKLESEAINIMLFTPKAVPAKFAKERQASAKIPIDMSMTPLYRYIYGAIHYVTHAEAGRDTMRIVDYEGKKGSELETDFFKNLIRVLGTDKAGALRDHLKKVIAPSFEKLDTFDKVTNWLRASSTLAALGGKLMPSIKQLQSAPRFLYELGPVKFLDGVTSFYAAPVEMFQMINEKSAFMHNRYEGSDTVLRHGVDGVMTGKWTHLNNAISEWAYMPMRIMDSMSSYPGWLAQYKSELEKNGGNEEEAIASADRLIQFSQATDRNIDKSEFQMGERGVKRLLNMFFAEAAVFGQRMKTYNKAWRNGKISTMSYIMYLMCDLIMPAMIAGLADYIWYGAQPKPGKEDKTWADYFYKNLGSSVVSGTPVIRDLAESTYNLFTGSKGNFNITPMNMTVELTGRTIKSMVSVYNSDPNTFEGQQKLDKFYLNLAETVGFATRSAPAINIYKQFKRIEKRIDEEEGVTP